MDRLIVPHFGVIIEFCRRFTSGITQSFKLVREEIPRTLLVFLWGA